jgi:hypothetical protein
VDIHHIANLDYNIDYQMKVRQVDIKSHDVGLFGCPKRGETNPFLSQKCRKGPETITFEEREREREKIVSNTKHIRRKPPN